MQSNIQDIIQIVESNSLTYEQKLFSLANVGERLISPIDSMGYTEEEMKYINNQMICDLNEGYTPYRPRYIVPDYSVFLKKGCKFLDILPPINLDECIDGLLILYKHVPSITSFPVFIGHIDQLLQPFITDEESDYIKIKRFLNHIDKTITDSFCHADIGPEETVAGKLILQAIIELENATPNMTFRYDSKLTSRDFAKLAAKACLLVSKPSFSNNALYQNDVGDHAIVSCYNALPLGGGAYTLSRLRLGTMVKQVNSLEQFMENLLPKVCQLMLSTMDKRIRYMVEKSNFFESSFLVDEGFIHKDNFTAMFGLVGLADAVNYFLELEGISETFGMSHRGDEIAHIIMSEIDTIVREHKGVYVSRTQGIYLLHAQVGATLHEEDKSNTPAHRIKVGQEPSLLDHLKQSAPFHQYFKSGTGDLFAFDQTYLDHLDAVVDIIEGSFHLGYRYITTYLKNTDLVRVTGYLVKKSEVEKARQNKAVLSDTTWFGSGMDTFTQVFDRELRT